MELNQATKQKFIEMFKNNREKIANHKKKVSFKDFENARLKLLNKRNDHYK